MHFFLNKSGWHRYWGYYDAWNTAKLSLHARAYMKHYGMSTDQLAKIMLGTTWHPNMGATTRAAVYPSGLPHDPNR